MGLVRAAVMDGGASIDHAVLPGELIAQAENMTGALITTVGDGAWSGANIANGIIRRSGPTGAYTDTTDTASNIIAALAGNGLADVVPGSTFRLLFQNTVAQAMTLAAGVGVKLGTGTTTTAASLVREYLFTILNAAPTVILNCATFTNKVITFNLQPQQSSLAEGTVQPGMVISGSGITAGTKVLGVTQGQGGITGCVTDTDTTATANPVALTFGPSVLIDGLRSSTL